MQHMDMKKGNENIVLLIVWKECLMSKISGAAQINVISSQFMDLKWVNQNTVPFTI